MPAGAGEVKQCRDREGAVLGPPVVSTRRGTNSLESSAFPGLWLQGRSPPQGASHIPCLPGCRGGRPRRRQLPHSGGDFSAPAVGKKCHRRVRPPMHGKTGMWEGPFGPRLSTAEPITRVPPAVAALRRPRSHRSQTERDPKLHRFAPF